MTKTNSKKSSVYQYTANTVSAREKETKIIAAEMSKEIGIEIETRTLDYLSYAWQGAVCAKVIMGIVHVYAVALHGDVDRIGNETFLIPNHSRGDVTLRIPNCTGVYIVNYRTPEWDAFKEAKEAGINPRDNYEEYLDFLHSHEAKEQQRWFSAMVEELYSI